MKRPPLLTLGAILLGLTVSGVAARKAPRPPATLNPSALRLDAIHVWHDQGPRVSRWLDQAWRRAKNKTPLVITEAAEHDQSFGLGDGRPDAILLPSKLLHRHGEWNLAQVPAAEARLLKKRFARTALSDGNLYGLPVFVSELLLLYYNKRLVSKPILDLDHLKALRAVDASFTPIAWAYETPTYLAPFLIAYDAWPAEEKPVELDLPSFADALGAYQELALSEVVDPGCDRECSLRNFLAGKAPYAIGGVSWIAPARDELGKDLGVAALPAAHGKQLRPLYGTFSIAFPFNSLNASESHRTQLLRFARALTDQTGQKALVREVLRVPVNSRVFESASRMGSSELKVALRETRKALPMPNRPEMSSLWSALRKVVILSTLKGFQLPEARKYAQDLFMDLQRRPPKPTTQ